MNKTILKRFLWSIALLVIGSSLALSNETPRPNVIIIYGDDVGFGDVGIHGSEMIPTPNIDRLASQGIRFTDGHCTAATCSPSRFSMLTGVHDFRYNIGILSPTAPLCIPTGLFTLPKMFKQAGYQTGIVGKWHLGVGEKSSPVDWNGMVKPGPLELGFDHSFIIPSTNDRVPCVYLDGHHVVNLDLEDPIFVSNRTAVERNEKTKNSTVYPIGKDDPASMTYYTTKHEYHMATVINGIGRIGYMVGGKTALWDDETMADVFMEQTKVFIRDNKDRPFFLFFSSQDIHAPRTPHRRFHGESELGYRGDAMVQLDWSTGEIMKTLDENGLSENTIVIFTSDNGPAYNDGLYDDGTVGNGETDRGHDGSGPYRGGKYQIYEGGTRVPFIIRWPGKIAANIESDALVSQIDFLASFAALLGLELEDDQGSDSRNTLDAFLGNDPRGLPYLIEFAARRLALRQGNWKYVAHLLRGENGVELGKPEMLFNLENDIGEENNLLLKLPERAEQMHQMLSTLASDGHQLRKN